MHKSDGPQLSSVPSLIWTLWADDHTIVHCLLRMLITDSK